MLRVTVIEGGDAFVTGAWLKCHFLTRDRYAKSFAAYLDGKDILPLLSYRTQSVNKKYHQISYLKITIWKYGPILKNRFTTNQICSIIN